MSVSWRLVETRDLPVRCISYVDSFDRWFSQDVVGCHSVFKEDYCKNEHNNGCVFLNFFIIISEKYESKCNIPLHNAGYYAQEWMKQS